jgi:phospholipid/cholesterol/gamma-HCH transport system permease protein
MTPKPELAPLQPKTTLSVTLQGGSLCLRGDFTVWALRELPAGVEGLRQVDLSGLGRLDTAAAWYLIGLRDQGIAFTGLSTSHQALLDSVADARPKPEAPAPVAHGWRVMVEALGRKMAGAGVFLAELAEYLGRFLAGLWRGLRHPSQFRLTSLVYHCHETGMRAVPIVALMSFLIGVVLAFQGAAQLRQLGAEIFVVDLITISILRELGILLTSIIVAGRTASALTASIGSMKMQEEIDAMRTLGLDPDMVLIVPRVLALVLVLPVLGLVSNVMGLLGGAIMSWIALGISPAMFQYRMIADTDVSNVIVGLSKAPVFALVIGIIGCRAGMKVGNDAASLGAQTSTAVVEAIFAVIVIDALFSIFFSAVGL